MLELEQVAGRVEEHEGPVLFGHGAEPGRDVGEERDLADDRQFVQRLEIRCIAERDPEMPRVQAGWFFPRRRALPISRREVADQLIAEEVQRYPVGITPGQLAAEKI